MRCNDRMQNRTIPRIGVSEVWREERARFKATIGIAKKKGCDLILMASHGHGAVGGLLLGNEAQKVLTHSHIPVLIYR